MPKVGFKHTMESRAKMSVAAKGRTLSQEHRAKIGAALKGNRHTLDYRHTALARAKIGDASRGNKYALGHRHTAIQRTKISVAGKGRPVSDKTRAKMSAARTGIKFSPEHRAALSATAIGKKRGPMSPEHKAKIGLANKGNGYLRLGRKHSPEAIAKMSLGRMGEKNPAWHGGISGQTYAWTFNETLKAEVRRRDGQHCQLCGIPQTECGHTLQIHHIDGVRTNSDPVNLITLCTKCHGRTKTNRKHWIAYFQAKALDRDLAGLRARSEKT